MSFETARSNRPTSHLVGKGVRRSETKSLHTILKVHNGGGAGEAAGLHCPATFRPNTPLVHTDIYDSKTEARVRNTVVANEKKM
jgi:hypothetical protein